MLSVIVRLAPEPGVYRALGSLALNLLRSRYGMC